MFENNYGKMSFNGKEVEIDKLSLDELKKCFDELEKKQKKNIEEQNEFLSKLLI